MGTIYNLASGLFICQAPHCLDCHAYLEESLFILDRLQTMFNIFEYSGRSLSLCVFVSSSWWLCTMRSSVGGRTVPGRPCPTATPVPPPAQNPSTTSPTCSTLSQSEGRLKSTRPASKQVCHICCLTSCAFFEIFFFIFRQRWQLVSFNQSRFCMITIRRSYSGRGCECKRSF